MNELRLVSTYDDEMRVVTSGTSDREQSPTLRLLVVCRDAGQSVLETVRQLVVMVDDVNDNVPQFTQSVYNVSVVENQQPPVVSIGRGPAVASPGLDRPSYHQSVKDLVRGGTKRN